MCEQGDNDDTGSYHLLYPDYYLEIAKGGHLTAQAGYYALPIIMGLIALGRNLGTSVDVSDPTKGVIGDDIPQMTMVTVDLIFPSRLQERYKVGFERMVC
ncbi:uncharacterized protein LDX57_008208 [Aspergillus melleus]|uniref:uncharacterized protein n=1 Tax=Aspergillus melleus TaxID=138277 RepID=UPI001E8E9672|nr:uncharacterized protein LDX57_008208 [Aspergillus melleus]KAH8430544.1 hypothetical protein LDX57_008208 [Aspergillus melleus]